MSSNQHFSNPANNCKMICSRALCILRNTILMFRPSVGRHFWQDSRSRIRHYCGIHWDMLLPEMNEMIRWLFACYHAPKRGSMLTLPVICLSGTSAVIYRPTWILLITVVLSTWSENIYIILQLNCSTHFPRYMYIMRDVLRTIYAISRGRLYA